MSGPGREIRDGQVTNRPVYTAPTEQAAKERLGEFHATWGERYPATKGLWDNAWAEFVPFLDYSSEIRRVIYSTNAIESLNAPLHVAKVSRDGCSTSEPTLSLQRCPCRVTACCLTRGAGRDSRSERGCRAAAGG
jgi:transposase-like protein